MNLIYLIHNTLNAKTYVGKTSESTQARWRKHLDSAKRGVRTHLHNAIRKYGSSAFRVSVIDTCDSELADERERLWIKLIGSHESAGGYNQTWGGEGGAAHRGHQHTAATKLLISQKKKGFRHSPESIAKFSKSLKGRVFSTEHRHKLSLAQKGRKQSEEQRRRHSVLMKGRFSGEKNRMFGIRLCGEQNGFFGRTHSEATKQHWSTIRKGRTLSEEHRLKISAGNLRRWARIKAEAVSAGR